MSTTLEVIDSYLSLDSTQYAQAPIGATRLATKGNGTNLYGTIPTWTATNWEIEFDVVFPTSYPGTQGVATWTQHTTPADNNWKAVAWSPELGLFAAVADSGTGDRVMTSPDGVTWTIRTSPADNGWRNIIWVAELGLFVAVAYSGTNRAMSSSDGITWTLRTPAADNNWRDLVWSPSLGLIVAVGDSGTGNRVMTSTNGTTWTIRTSAEDSAWTSVAWSPELGLFAAVANAGTNRVMTSPDGVTWTARSASAANGWGSVVWSAGFGMFFAIAGSGSSRGMYSTDGVTWTARVPALDTAFNRVIWAPEINTFLVTSSVSTGTNVVTSINGVGFTQRSFFPTTNQWYGSVWSPELGIFVLVGGVGTGNRAMTSGALNTLLSGPVSSNKFVLGTDTNTGDIITVLKGGATLQLDGVTITKNIVPHPVDGAVHKIKLSSATSPITVDRLLHMTRTGFLGTATIFNLYLRDLGTSANSRFYPMDETIAGTAFNDTSANAQHGTWFNRVAGDVVTVYPGAIKPGEEFWVACKYKINAVTKPYPRQFLMYGDDNNKFYLMSLTGLTQAGFERKSPSGIDRASNSSAYGANQGVDGETHIVVAKVTATEVRMWIDDITLTGSDTSFTGAQTTAITNIYLNGDRTGTTVTPQDTIDINYFYLYSGTPSNDDINALMAGENPMYVGDIRQGYNLAGNGDEVNGGNALTLYNSPTFYVPPNNNRPLIGNLLGSLISNLIN